MVGAILNELEKREIIEYPDALIDATISLLANDKMLNVMIKILFKKTNVYNANQVHKALIIAKKWFKRLHKMQTNVPSSFDCNFFTKAIKIML